MKKTLLKWELIGIVFVLFLGALLHFVFEWSGKSIIVAIFAPVNESIWEHFKLGFWPMCLYAVIEYGFLRTINKNLSTAKVVAVYVIPIIIGLAFYTYTVIIGKEILIVDISIFAVAIVIGQLISYKILASAKLPEYINIISMAFIVILAIVLITFTFDPPHLPIFLDQNTGSYGIP